MEEFMKYLIGKTLIITISIISICFSLISCDKITYTQSSTSDNTSNSNEFAISYTDIMKMPIENVTASITYVFDRNNLSALIGYVDYVFVGKVVEYIRTDYDFYVDAQGNYYQTDNSRPRTVYKVEVIRNIKNELKKNIELYRSGGLRKDQSAVIVYEDTSLLNINEINIFYGIAQSDGRLFVIGNDNEMKLDIDENYDADGKSMINDEIEINDKYIKVIEAFHNEIVYDRERTIAIEDINNVIENI
jgi:hypothetical protein